MYSGTVRENDYSHYGIATQEGHCVAVVDANEYHCVKGELQANCDDSGKEWRVCVPSHELPYAELMDYAVIAQFDSCEIEFAYHRTKIRTFVIPEDCFFKYGAKLYNSCAMRTVSNRGDRRKRPLIEPAP